jgi:hypothetical protein
MARELGKKAEKERKEMEEREKQMKKQIHQEHLKVKAKVSSEAELSATLSLKDPKAVPQIKNTTQEIPKEAVEKSSVTTLHQIETPGTEGKTIDSSCNVSSSAGTSPLPGKEISLCTECSPKTDENTSCPKPPKEDHVVDAVESQSEVTDDSKCSPIVENRKVSHIRHLSHNSSSSEAKSIPTPPPHQSNASPRAPLKETKPVSAASLLERGPVAETVLKPQDSKWGWMYGRCSARL